ncbi:helix-turn-helix domain-containing protein [Ancylobacter pratisalsi]|uniref:ImmA/IrrE family metallo-endopeptidase n=1 Tax=Ancylobacter pratisalsi TaxID=1745854 RepID=A0A6P1YI88_9HYPH|nr:XRE family transcriptional regulator [Ancylobacter pratisalsi]QIB32680.1 ImmA/IrrE family metallo-endopeptidase [Ancylobacter pratisalsi]
MRPGTPGFIARRLVEAREARSLNRQLALGNLIGKPSSTISRWETGEVTPEPEALDALARALNVRRSYFLRPMPDHGGGAFFLRARKSVEPAVQARERARLRWAQDISLVLQHYYEFPTYDVPDFLRGRSYASLDNEDIEAIAIDLRTHWNLGTGPITSMISVLEMHGFVVVYDVADSGRLDGVCNWSESDQRPYVLLARDKESFFRSQMDAAHEMAHAILHRHLTQEQFEQDFDRIESQAFRLASAFLMPATSFAVEVRHPTLAGLLALKERWRCSVKAMIMRCNDLDLIDKASATQLYKHYSFKGWNRGEPLDRDWPRDKPKLMARAIIDLVEDGIRSRQDLLETEFVISARDIEDLASLPNHWFDSAGNVISLPLSRKARPL